MGGINSGYDTEAMIEQMLQSYQTKIDNQNKKLTKLGWQQEAYRDVIDKLTTFKNKYFDILKKDSYLLSPNTFHKYASKVTGKTVGADARGINVTTTSSSAVGSHSVTVQQLATAATAKGKTIVPANFGLDLNKAAENSNYTENEDGTRNYTFSLDVKVGDVTKTVEFSAENVKMNDDGTVDMGEFTSAVTKSLNESLADSFGRTGKDTNDEDGIDDYFIQAKSGDDGKLTFDINGNAAVTVIEKEGSFGLAKASKAVAISAQSAVTGKNTVAVGVGGEVKNVTFEGVSDTYFDSRNESGNGALLDEYNKLKEAAYRRDNNIPSFMSVDKSALDKYTYTSAQAAKDKNTAALKSALNDAFAESDVSFSISDKGYVTASKGGVAQEFSMTTVDGGTLGLEKGYASNRMSAKTTLRELGITGNNIVMDGSTGETVKNYSFEINGKKIELDENATINDLIDAVNSSGAGVTMSFSSLTSSFELKANNLGSSEKIEFGLTDSGDPNRILQELGLVDAEMTAGQNAVFNIDGTEIYHNSNSYTMDGTTYSFTDDITIGEEYTVGVSKSYDDVKQTIKDFVNDYNQLIDDVYGHIGTAPARDKKNNLYEPLTDAEKEEMDDKEIEKWEEAAKKGVIYQDSTVTRIMSQLRSTIYNSITLDDGSKFSLVSMGIKTTSFMDSTGDDFMHGKLTIDEDALNAAFENNPDAIEKLFTDPNNGVMSKINNILDNAVRTTGSVKGSLINKAGLASGSSAKDNYIYRQMESVKDRISQLQDRYDAKEEYWWSVFTNLEKVMGDLNDQSAYLSQYLGGYGNYQ